MRSLFNSCALILWLCCYATSLLAAPNDAKSFTLYLRNYFEPQDVQNLAKFDALGLDADVAVDPTNAAVLTQLRTLNPGIKLLAYIPINGTFSGALNIGNPASNWKKMYQYAESQSATRWLWSTTGAHIFDWPGKYTINLTFNCALRHTRNAQGVLQAPACSSTETNKLNWYVDFILNDVLQNGTTPWDGVLLDDVWVGIAFINSNQELNPNPIDFDRDGIADPPATLDPLWKQGNRWISGEIRRRMDLNPALRNKILIGNGGNDFYVEMNGAYMENFPLHGQLDPAPNPLNYSWNDKMFGTYGYYANEDNYSTIPERLNVLDYKWNDYVSNPPSNPSPPARTHEFLRGVRLVTASAFLREGYASVDMPFHSSTWWQVEFEKQLGSALGAAFQFTSQGKTLWRRDFSNGSVIVNPNPTMYPGSTTDRIPPIAWWDAALLLNSEFWISNSTPPPAITDLGVVRTSNNFVELEWSNINCPDNPALGHCAQLEMRYSNAPINDSNWAQATLAGSIVPEAPGYSTKQKYLVSGLSQNQPYYFAIKSKGLSGVWSSSSNSVSALTAPSDSIAPAAISDLQVDAITTTTATVSWSSSGDDGTSGLATSFDLRYWTGANNYNSGAQVVGEPTPAAAGTRQSMTLYGLTPNSSYSFAIKVGDEMPNWSALSNLAVRSTLAGDTTAPAAITDLRVSATGPGTVLLTWTASGDDGASGRANNYDLRYLASPAVLSAANFSTANYITNEPGPETSGAEQSMVITGLGNAGYTYSFAIKACDEATNCSTISNVVSATTRSSGDVSAPSAITDLRVTQSSSNTLTLTWSTTGDDGSTGQASSYDLRFLTVPLSSSNFSQATRVSGISATLPAGQTQNHTITGLTPNTDYYLAVRVGDEVPLFSTLSNVISARTSRDNTAPAAPGTLSVR